MTGQKEELQGRGLDSRLWIVMVSCLVMGLLCMKQPLVMIQGKGFLGEKLLSQLEAFQNEIRVLSVLAAGFLLVAGMDVLIQKAKGEKWAVLCMGLAGILLCLIGVRTLIENGRLNQELGREQTIINLLAHCYLQLTSWVYGICFGLAALIFASRSLFGNRSRKLHMGRRTGMACILAVTMVPFSIFFGIYFLQDRSYLFISLCIVFWAMVPFFMAFEDRKPKAREIVIIAVLTALTVAGRAAFFMIPQFKPVMALVIIAGAAFGPETGFLTGALGAFVSNFFFGQGPWTPWQMFAFGLGGLLSGLVFKGKREKWKDHRILVAVFGGLVTFGEYGFIMDTASVLMYTARPTGGAFLAMYASGLMFNLIHGISTVVFLLLLSGPMFKKLERVKKKYGLISEG